MQKNGTSTEEWMSSAVRSDTQKVSSKTERTQLARSGWDDVVKRDQNTNGDGSMLPLVATSRVNIAGDSATRSGAFGQVYLHVVFTQIQLSSASTYAKSPTTSEPIESIPCVVKEVRRDTIGQELQYNLQHPNIIRFYGYYNVVRDGVEYVHIVMERGERVLQDLDMTATDATEKRKILLDIAAGLRYLGQQGVMHRDLKPANVVCVGGTWKIIDFGLARRHMRHRLNEDGQVAVDDLAAGTREFTDPVCRDPHRACAYVGLPRELQAQIDVYSLGRIMRWMFPTDAEVMSIEYDCTRCELFRRCTTDEICAHLDRVQKLTPPGTPCFVRTLSPPPSVDAGSLDSYARVPPPGEPTLQKNQFRYVAWRDPEVKRTTELRLRFMQYYHGRFAEGISDSNASLPFELIFCPPTVQHVAEGTTCSGGVMLIEGGEGSGKTVLAKHFARQQVALLATPKSYVVVIPLRVFATMKSGPITERDVLRACLASEANQQHSFVEDTIALFKPGVDRLVCVIDVDADNDDEQQVLRVLAADTSSIPARVCLLSRPIAGIGRATQHLQLLPWSMQDACAVIHRVTTHLGVPEQHDVTRISDQLVSLGRDSITPEALDRVLFSKVA